MQVITAGCEKRDILLVPLVWAESITEIHWKRLHLTAGFIYLNIIDRLFRLNPDLFALNLGSIINRQCLK
jgi:hypothetical protein